MKKTMLILLLLCSISHVWSQEELQLAPPRITASSVYFSNTCLIDIAFNRAQSNIFYRTINGNARTKWKRYSKPFVISETTIIEAATRERGLKHSDITSIAVFKRGKAILSSEVSPGPSPLYPGNGNQGLQDHIGGSSSHQHPAWYGFDSGPVTILLKLEKATTLEKIVLHCLDHPEAWIHLPAAIEVLDEKEQVLQVLKTVEVSSGIARPANIALVLGLSQPFAGPTIQLRIFPVTSIPDGLPGAGQKAWFFIDEVNIY